MRPELFPQERTELLGRVIWAKQRRSVYWLGGGITCLAAAVMLTLIGRCGRFTDTTDFAPIASQIGIAIEASAHAARPRVERLASDKKVRPAIVTDARTVGDLINSAEFSFAPKPGETLELFKLERTKPSEPPSVVGLGRMPAQAPAVPALKPNETMLQSNGTGGVNVIVTAEVAEYDGSDVGGGKEKIGGVLSLSSPVELTAVREQLADAAVQVTMDTATSRIPLIAGPPSETKPLQFRVPTAPFLQLGEINLNVVPVAMNAKRWINRIAFASGGLGVVLMVFWVAFKRRRPPSVPLRRRATGGDQAFRR